jgi:hypothetical protein
LRYQCATNSLASNLVSSLPCLCRSSILPPPLSGSSLQPLIPLVVSRPVHTVTICWLHSTLK